MSTDQVPETSSSMELDIKKEVEKPAAETATTSEAAPVKTEPSNDGLAVDIKKEAPHLLTTCIGFKSRHRPLDEPLVPVIDHQTSGLSGGTTEIRIVVAVPVDVCQRDSRTKLR